MWSRGAPRGLTGAVIAALLLVLGHQAIELVSQRVDCRIHVGVRGIRVDVATADVQRCFGLLGKFLYGQDAVDVDNLIEMPHDPHQFLLHIGLQCCRDFDVMTLDV